MLFEIVPNCKILLSKQPHLQRIYLKTLVGNVASQRVAQRAGYQPIASPNPQDEDWIWFECKAADVELPKQELRG